MMVLAGTGAETGHEKKECGSSRSPFPPTPCPVFKASWKSAPKGGTLINTVSQPGPQRPSPKQTGAERVADTKGKYSLGVWVPREGTSRREWQMSFILSC